MPLHATYTHGYFFILHRILFLKRRTWLMHASFTLPLTTLHAQLWVWPPGSFSLIFSIMPFFSCVPSVDPYVPAVVPVFPGP